MTSDVQVEVEENMTLGGIAGEMGNRSKSEEAW